MDILEQVIQRFNKQTRRTSISNKNKPGTRKSESFLVVVNGKKYKVRECNTMKHAKGIENWMNYLASTPLAEHLPAFLGRERNLIVKEYVEGRELLYYEYPSVLRKLGGMIADIHNLQPPEWLEQPSIEEFKREFYQNMEVIEKQHPNLTHAKVFFEKNLPERLKVACIAHDLLMSSNIILTTDRRLVIVEHESWVVNLPNTEYLRSAYSSLDAEYVGNFYKGYNERIEDKDQIIKQHAVTALYTLSKEYVQKTGRTTKKVEVETKRKEITDKIRFVLEGNSLQRIQLEDPSLFIPGMPESFFE